MYETETRSAMIIVSALDLSDAWTAACMRAGRYSSEFFAENFKRWMAATNRGETTTVAKPVASDVEEQLRLCYGEQARIFWFGDHESDFNGIQFDDQLNPLVFDDPGEDELLAETIDAWLGTLGDEPKQRERPTGNKLVLSLSSLDRLCIEPLRRKLFDRVVDVELLTWPGIRPPSDLQKLLVSTFPLAGVKSAFPIPTIADLESEELKRLSTPTEPDPEVLKLLEDLWNNADKED
jgi:hypothetical protein